MNKHKRFLSSKFYFLFALAAVMLWLSMDGNHYWHDVRFLYAASQFPMSEIISGTFNPHQLGGCIDQTSSGGFYLAKVLHIWILQQVYKWVLPNGDGFILSTWLSVLYLGLAILFSYRLYRRLLQNELQAWFALYCFLIAPITAYLAGKLLSETLAIFLITISLWTFITAMDAARIRCIWLMITSGCFLLLAALARLDILICPVGFFTAYLFGVETPNKRLKILKSGAFLIAFFATSYIGTIYSLGGEIKELVQYFKSFVGLEVKSNMMSILGILTFGGMVYFLALGAILHPEKKKFLFFAIWFVVSAGFAVLITRNYMVEPRYLIASLLPLSGLGALGFEVLWQKITHKPYKLAVIGGLVISILVFNAMIMRIMPYELNRSSILKATDDIMKLNKNAQILIPWFYTDFNFLHVMRPNLAIYNVNSPIRDGMPVKLDNKWKQRIDSWYGKAYIDSPTALDRVLENGTGFYLGWRKYPPAENMRKFAAFLGFRTLGDFMDKIPLTDHLIQSWIWYSSKYYLKMAGKCGQYEYYYVRKGQENGIEH